MNVSRSNRRLDILHHSMKPINMPIKQMSFQNHKGINIIQYEHFIMLSKRIENSNVNRAIQTTTKNRLFVNKIKICLKKNKKIEMKTYV